MQSVVLGPGVRKVPTGMLNDLSALRYVEFPSGYDAANASRWSRQGMLWKVYDDRIVIRRREFLLGRELGPDWVMPLLQA